MGVERADLIFRVYFTTAMRKDQNEMETLMLLGVKAMNQILYERRYEP